MTAPDLDGLFRREASRLVPYLLRRLGPRRFDLAEDAVQDAFVEAVRRWPHRGVPDDPRAWLLRVAHRKALDRLRRDATAERKSHLLFEEGVFELEPERTMADEAAVLLLACHPALPRDQQVALALRSLGGLTTSEVARALLISEAAAAQRIVRAKRELEGRGVEPLAGPDLEARLDGTLEVLYLIYSEGHQATGGPDLVRADLVGEALRLAEALASSPATARPRVDALLSLMHFGASRLRARTDTLGDLVLFGDQDRGAWDERHIALGFRHLGAASRGDDVSRFHLEAGIAALHAQTPQGGEPDWPRILDLYDALVAAWPSPVIALNRAVAVLRVRGSEAAEAALQPALKDPALASYAPLHVIGAEVAHAGGDGSRALRRLDRALACPLSEPQRRFIARLREARAASAGP